MQECFKEIFIFREANKLHWHMSNVYKARTLNFLDKITLPKDLCGNSHYHHAQST